MADGNRTVHFDTRIFQGSHFSVPAIPDETLRMVFGGRRIDFRVEQAVLYVEIYTREGIPKRHARIKILEYIRKRIDDENIYDFISLLAKRGIADEFFELTNTLIDDDRSMLTFLLDNGITMDVIRYYAKWNGIDPKSFFIGFTAGLIESGVTVITDFFEMAKMLGRLLQTEVKTLLLLATDPKAGRESLYQQAMMIGKMFDALLEQLDLTRLPAEVVNTWKGWNEKFEKHLENLDPYSAGKHLGRIAGDLWQMLTGFVALIKLLRVAGKLALRYAPLLFGSIKSTAAEARIIVSEFASLLKQIGKNVLDELPIVGMDVLKTLFPPEVMRELFKKGRAFLHHRLLTLVPVYDQTYSLAFPGGMMPARFGVVICEEGKPMLMAQVSERLPIATHEEAMAAIDKILEKIDKIFDDPGKSWGQQSLIKAEIRAAGVKLLKENLSFQVRRTLQKTAYSIFNELRRKNIRFNARDFGQMIHRRMRDTISAVITKTAPNAWHRTEKTLKTIANELLDLDTNTTPKHREIVKNALSESIASMLVRRGDILDILGVEKTTAARSKDAIEKMLKQFKWDKNTKLGDLQSDLIIADPQIKRIINVDYTSSTNSDRFEKLWKTVSDDLGSKFDGDWSQLEEGYKRAGNRKVPAEVKDQLDKLTWHAVRETVIRQVALEEILGPGWNVSSHEITYDGLGKLWGEIRKKELKTSN